MTRWRRGFVHDATGEVIGLQEMQAVTIDAAHLAIVLVILNIAGAFYGVLKLKGELAAQGRDAEKHQKAIQEQSNAAIAQYARLDFKVETMWAFLVGDMMTGARTRGVVLEKSPIQVDDKFLRQFDSGFTQQLQSWYRQNNLYAVSQDELILFLAHEWKKQLIEKICHPLGASLGDALVAAVYIVKGIENA